VNHGDLAIVAVGLTETYPAGKHKTFTTIASAPAAERRCRTGWNGSGRPLVARRDQRFEVAGAEEAGRHHV
jgi:hypothetical protein